MNVVYGGIKCGIYESFILSRFNKKDNQLHEKGKNLSMIESEMHLHIT